MLCLSGFELYSRWVPLIYFPLMLRNKYGAGFYLLFTPNAWFINLRIQNSLSLITYKSFHERTILQAQYTRIGNVI